MKYHRLLRPFLVLALLFSSVAHAYTIFSLNHDGRSNRVETDVFVVGYAGEVWGQFLYTALTRAYKHIERYPNRQMLIIWAKDNGLEEDLKVAQGIPGARIIMANDAGLTMGNVVAELNKLHSISSLHFVGHSSATHGFGLQKDQRFSATRQISGLKRKFAQGAYVFLHGCNTAFESAPAFSALWEIPAFGSMTSTDFQQLHNDSSWYWNNRGQFPAGGWKRTNDQSFASAKSCTTRACHRLKPNNHPYTGSWGKYETGLSFYKSFCNFNIRNNRANRVCFQGIWEAIHVWPSVKSINTVNASLEDYKTVVKDFLCPKIDGYSIDSVCLNILDTAEKTGETLENRFYWGNQPKCTLSGCEIEKVPGVANDGTRVTIFSSENAQNEALVQEYKMYLEVYRAYKGNAR